MENIIGIGLLIMLGILLLIIFWIQSYRISVYADAYEELYKKAVELINEHADEQFELIKDLELQKLENHQLKIEKSALQEELNNVKN